MVEYEAKKEAYLKQKAGKKSRREDSDDGSDDDSDDDGIDHEPMNDAEDGECEIMRKAGK
jgi:hypothetical protein